MPQLNIFSLLRESDEEFIQRTGWTYQPLSPVYGLGPDVQILEPYWRPPRGGSRSSLGGGQGIAQD